MDKDNFEELNLYRSVIMMTNDIVFCYDYATDTMCYHTGQMANLGSYFSNYTQMLRRQKESRPELKVEDFIEALTNPERGYFECEVSLSDMMGRITEYVAVGKLDNRDRSESTQIIGRLAPKRMTAKTSSKEGREPLTGLYTRSMIKDFLAEKCADAGNRDMAFLELKVQGLQSDNMKITVAQYLKRRFPYDVYIAKNKTDGFFVLYYGDDVRDYFLAKINDIKPAIEQLGAEERLEVYGGLYVGSFADAEEYEIREKAHVALISNRNHAGDKLTVYTREIENVDDIQEKLATLESQNNFQFDHRLVEKALEIVSENGDVDEAAGLIFGKIGSKYGIDRIYVQELDKTSETAKVTYNWVGDNYRFVNGVVPMDNSEDYGFLLGEYSGKDMIVVNDVYDTSVDLRFRRNAHLSGLKSFVRCIYSDSHGACGCLAFECYAGRHDWSESELKTFRLVTQLVSVCLLKLRSYEEIMNVRESYATHDSLTGMLKYTNFLDEVRKYIASNPADRLAFVSLSIRDIVAVNARYGYDVGDEILKEISKAVSEEETFLMGSRPSADNFVLMIQAYDHRGSRASGLAVNRINDRLSEKFAAVCTSMDISVTAGIAIVTEQRPVEEYIDMAADAKGRALNAGLDAVVV